MFFKCQGIFFIFQIFFLDFLNLAFINIKLIKITMIQKITLNRKDLNELFEVDNDFPYTLHKTNSPEVFDEGYDYEIAKNNFNRTIRYFEKNEKKSFSWNEFKEEFLSLNWEQDYDYNGSTYSYNHKENAENFVKHIENYSLEDFIPNIIPNKITEE